MIVCEMPKCESKATVQKWDCCEGTQFYCTDHNWNGATTEMCEWEDTAI